jgi:hypothetical protein
MVPTEPTIFSCLATSRFSPQTPSHMTRPVSLDLLRRAPTRSGRSLGCSPTRLLAACRTLLGACCLLHGDRTLSHFWLILRRVLCASPAVLWSALAEAVTQSGSGDMVARLIVVESANGREILERFKTELAWPRSRESQQHRADGVVQQFNSSCLSYRHELMLFSLAPCC